MRNYVKGSQRQDCENHRPRGFSPGAPSMNHAPLPYGNEILCPANGSNIVSIHPNSFLQRLLERSLISSYHLKMWRMVCRVMGEKARQPLPVVPPSNVDISQEVEHDRVLDPASVIPCGRQSSWAASLTPMEGKLSTHSVPSSYLHSLLPMPSSHLSSLPSTSFKHKHSDIYLYLSFCPSLWTVTLTCSHLQQLWQKTHA